MKKILFAASECVPFIKTGGLADVVGSLPKYINKDEFDVRVILPKYMAIQQKYKDQMEFITNFTVNLSWRSQYLGLFRLVYEGVTFYFVDNEFYFAGSHPTDTFTRISRSLLFSARPCSPCCRLWTSVRISFTAMTGRPA